MRHDRQHEKKERKLWLEAEEWCDYLAEKEKIRSRWENRKKYPLFQLQAEHFRNIRTGCN